MKKELKNKIILGACGIFFLLRSFAFLGHTELSISKISLAVDLLLILLVGVGVLKQLFALIPALLIGSIFIVEDIARLIQCRNLFYLNVFLSLCFVACAFLTFQRKA